VEALALELTTEGVHRGRHPPLLHNRTVGSAEPADELRHSATLEFLSVHDQNEHVLGILGVAGADVNGLFGR